MIPRALDVARSTPGGVAALRESLWFVRSYPDDASVLSIARDAIAALPAPDPVTYAFSYETAACLARLRPASIDIAWDRAQNDVALQDTLFLLASRGEAQAIEDIDIPVRDWFAARRSTRDTDLGLLLRLLRASGLSTALESHLFERCGLLLRYAPADPLALETPARIHFQRGPLDRESFPLEPEIRRPMPPLRRAGRAMLDIAVQSLAARALEIYPLLHADPRDVVVMDGGRGLRIALAGVVPGRRSLLEALHFFLILKNGLPIAYGPAAVSFGCCEMGINLFPELRGAEIRHVYAELMRLLHQRLGVEYFHLTRYGMGEGNEEAIQSGAFWFYRKLGFLPTSPRVARLAESEERKRAADPDHRSDRRMLLRLSHTEAYFDLSGGRRSPMPLGLLGLAESRAAAHGRPRHRGDFSPLLSLFSRRRWTAGELASLRAVVAAKSARSEAAFARRLARHRRLEEALRALASSSRADRASREAAR
ncbi:MAG: hypothetical protein U0166_01420 [Acidobacteriota bacterium]